MNDIAKVEDPFITLVERFAGNPAIDAEKLEKLVDIQIRIVERQAEAEFNAALADVQSRLPTVGRNKRNPQTGSMYADLDAIAKAIKPIYTGAGFSTSFSQGETSRADHIRICGTLSHAAGHSREYFVDLPIDDKGQTGKVNKTPMHGTGSSFAYGRRYVTAMMFDVATGDDDDGTKGEKREDTLNEEEVTELRELLKKAGIPEAKLLQANDCERMEDLPAKYFEGYVIQIEEVAKKRAAKEQA